MVVGIDPVQIISGSLSRRQQRMGGVTSGRVASGLGETPRRSCSFSNRAVEVREG
ncbi:MAG: hypothetical protein ABI923_01220 [bacterium]